MVVPFLLAALIASADGRPAPLVLSSSKPPRDDFDLLKMRFDEFARHPDNDQGFGRRIAVTTFPIGVRTADRCRQIEMRTIKIERTSLAVVLTKNRSAFCSFGERLS